MDCAGDHPRGCLGEKTDKEEETSIKNHPRRSVEGGVGGVSLPSVPVSVQKSAQYGVTPVLGKGGVPPS